jgi:hypothetical protein
LAAEAQRASHGSSGVLEAQVAGDAQRRQRLDVPSGVGADGRLGDAQQLGDVAHPQQWRAVVGRKVPPVCHDGDATRAGRIGRASGNGRVGVRRRATVATSAGLLACHRAIGNGRPRPTAR